MDCEFFITTDGREIIFDRVKPPSIETRRLAVAEAKEVRKRFIALSDEGKKAARDESTREIERLMPSFSVTPPCVIQEWRVDTANWVEANSAWLFVHTPSGVRMRDAAGDWLPTDQGKLMIGMVAELASLGINDPYEQLKEISKSIGKTL